MLLPSAARVRALLCLCLCLNLAATARCAPARRDNSSPTITSDQGTSTSPGPSTTDVGSISTTLSSSVSPSPVNGTSTNSTVSTILPIPTATNGTDSPLNTTLFNTTIPEGELPLTPQLTPGFAVAGVLLLGTGTGYALFGIKTKWIHSFMASAYLASLGTAILILYVMALPVSDAIQGAYVVAVVCTGLVLGGAAVVFKDITECLACLVGGFCLSMWLLTLRDGGLVPQTGAKVVFIAAFTLAALGTYFSHWTRHYGLITWISFSGATAAVLGIDCLSRAGLKEFWVYIWALNDHLFPLGADTYPLTKGIKVELAATILIFIAGIVSQLKLWNVIQIKRDQRERQRAEGRRQIETQELSVGQRVEWANHRERRQWERVYGDGADQRFVDSGVGDMDNEMTKIRSSGTAVTSSRVVSPTPVDELAQMVEIPLDDDLPPAPPRKVPFRDTRAARVSIRVAQDDIHPIYRNGGDVGPAQEKKVWVVGSDGEARLLKEETPSTRALSPPPEIVPLPFTVPVAEEDEIQDDRSSLAADIDDEGEVRSILESKRNSLAKRLSVGSAELMRSLSRHSKGEAIDAYEEGGESREDLVASRQSRHRDDTSSLAATFDELSSEDGDNFSDPEEQGHHVKVAVGRSKNTDQEKRKFEEERSTQAWLSPSKAKLPPVGTSAVETIPTKLLPHPDAEPAQAGVETTEPAAINSPMDGATDSTKGSEARSQETKSVASADITSEGLKQEHLPRLSRVALSYRTNEWAKHLSNADIPEPDTLRLSQPVVDTPEPIVEESAPVDIEELQKTAENGARPPAAPRSASAMSNYPVSRNNSRMSLVQAESRNISPTGQNFPPQVHKNLKRGPNNRRTSTSAQLLSQPIAEEGAGEVTASRSPTVPEATSRRSSSQSAGSSPILGHPASSSEPNLPGPVPGVTSYSSPQTLIGKREMQLRNKSQASFYVCPTPEPYMMPTVVSRGSSESGSLYNYPGTTVGLGIGGSSSRLSLDNSHDLDDLPLSQRRQILRQSSLGLQQQPYLVNAASAEFDSHQPLRYASGGPGHLPSEAARQAQLASFRSSVQADLRHGSGYASSPYAPGAANASATVPAFFNGAAGGVVGWDADVRRSVDQQRSFLMSQRDAEAQRREMSRLEKERSDREFEQRMRKGELLDAHREAMRRLQGGVNV